MAGRILPETLHASAMKAVRGPFCLDVNWHRSRLDCTSLGLCVRYHAHNTWVNETAGRDRSIDVWFDVLFGTLLVSLTINTARS